MRGARGAGGLLLALVTAGCGEGLAPQSLSPGDVLGLWSFRSPECEYFGETMPRATVRISEASETLGGRLNVRGSWDEIGLPPSAVPSEGVFTGNIDRRTGDFDLLLWKAGFQNGDFRGTIDASLVAEGRLSWGFCRGKRGTRVEDE